MWQTLYLIHSLYNTLNDTLFFMIDAESLFNWIGKSCCAANKEPCNREPRTRKQTQEFIIHLGNSRIPFDEKFNFNFSTEFGQTQLPFDCFFKTSFLVQWQISFFSAEETTVNQWMRSWKDEFHVLKIARFQCPMCI